MSHSGRSSIDPAETYKVRYHVWPEYLVADGVPRQVGFEVELVGAHTSDPNHLDPACLICHHVRSALRDIAEILIHNAAVAGNGAVSCQVEPHDGEIVWSGNCAVVAVSIVVRRTHDFARPTDAAELAVLNAIQSDLSELGIGSR